MKRLLQAGFLTLSVLTAQVKAAEEVATVDAKTVEISGTRNPELKSYRAVLKGMDVFEEKHYLAPTANLRFLLIPKKKMELAFNDFNMRIVGDDTSIAIPISADGFFVFPRDKKAADENADVVLNQKKGLFRFWPDIRSDGVPENARRLGDLRLECEVLWSVGYEDVPFLIRNILRGLGGPCAISKVTIGYLSREKLSSATLVEGERRAPLKISADGFTYGLTPHNKAWSDDALVELKFADANLTGMLQENSVAESHATGKNN